MLIEGSMRPIPRARDVVERFASGCPPLGQPSPPIVVVLEAERSAVDRWCMTAQRVQPEPVHGHRPGRWVRSVRGKKLLGVGLRLLQARWVWELGDFVVEEPPDVDDALEAGGRFAVPTATSLLSLLTGSAPGGAQRVVQAVAHGGDVDAWTVRAWSEADLGCWTRSASSRSLYRAITDCSRAEWTWDGVRTHGAGGPT